MKQKNTLFIGIALLCMTCISPTNAQEQEFFTALQDIPIMKGLSEIHESTTSYDKPNGRIIETYATSETISKEAITEYYNRILPQFGWGATSKTTYYRKGETLEISFEEKNQSTILKVTIIPSL